MNSEEQKRIWREEKEQMRQDNAPRLQYRPVPIRFGGTKKPADAKKTSTINPTTWTPDEILKKNLGLF